MDHPPSVSKFNFYGVNQFTGYNIRIQSVTSQAEESVTSTIQLKKCTPGVTATEIAGSSDDALSVRIDSSPQMRNGKDAMEIVKAVSG